MSRIEYNVAFRDNRGGLKLLFKTSTNRGSALRRLKRSPVAKSLEFEHDQDPGRVVDRPTFLVKREISDWMVDD